MMGNLCNVFLSKNCFNKTVFKTLIKRWVIYFFNHTKQDNIVSTLLLFLTLFPDRIVTAEHKASYAQAGQRGSKGDKLTFEASQVLPRMLHLIQHGESNSA